MALQWTYGGRATTVRSVILNRVENRANANDRRHLDNANAQLVEMALGWGTFLMTLSLSLWSRVCSYENLLAAHIKARKRKTTKPDVQEFEKNLRENLELLRTELLLRCYRPKPLETFILRDPKTRKIGKSAYRDRVVHHALVNILEPIFEPRFLHCSFANRKGKGQIAAVELYEQMARKVSRNFTQNCYVLKADIYHYFPEVDHTILLKILQRRITDPQILWLIQRILANHYSPVPRKGMPLGNLTSQFFANVYLHELDWFVKHRLKVKHYARYVDDFVILHRNKAQLEQWRSEINDFLQQRLFLRLHSQKQIICEIKQGVSFLGFRVFPHHRLLRESNLRAWQRRFLEMIVECQNGVFDYDELFAIVEGWLAYAWNANTFKLRRQIGETIETHFPGAVSSVEIERWMKCIRNSH